MVVATAHIYSATRANGRTMPAETTPQPETWADWLAGDESAPGAGELLTRDELLARLRDEGIIVSSHDLKNWQRLGVLPLGIPHRAGRSTHARYPPQAVIALALVRQLQSQGHTMADIRKILRGTFRIPPEEGQIVVNRGAGTLALEHGRVIYRIAPPTATATGNAFAPDIILGKLDPPAGLQDQVAAFARMAEQAYGGRIVRAELRLIDERGLPLKFDLETAGESQE
jgi:hypothetical protein